MKGKNHSGSHPTPKKRRSFEKLSEGFTDLLYPSLKREDAAQQAFDIGTWAVSYSEAEKNRFQG